VRGQNSFMRKMLLIHAVTMGLLLAGMFGLSMAAMELSKETKVGAQGVLVTTAGEPVTVASADTYVGPTGELRQHGEAGEIVVTGGQPITLELTAGDDVGRRLEAGEWKFLDDLKHGQVRAFLKNMERAGSSDSFGLVLSDRAGGRVWAPAALMKTWVKSAGNYVAFAALVKIGPAGGWPKFNVACHAKKSDGTCRVEADPEIGNMLTEFSRFVGGENPAQGSSGSGPVFDDVTPFQDQVPDWWVTDQRRDSR